MLLKVVFYAYMNNIYSCRKIEDALKYHIHYMWLSGSQTPSFSTINRFRSEHLKDTVNKLFSQVVGLLVDMGQISLEEQYIDGTKMESVANKYSPCISNTVWHFFFEQCPYRHKCQLRIIAEAILYHIKPRTV